MKTIYIETTIPSYLTARTSNNIADMYRKNLTCNFWDNERNKYRLFVSSYVIDECKRGDSEAAKRRLEAINDIEQLSTNEEVGTLAKIYKELLNIPDRAEYDSYHLAISVIHNIDIVLTWNFIHMGIFTYEKLKEYNDKVGLKTPILTSPEIFINKEDNYGNP